MSTETEMTTNALAGWYGSARGVARKIGAKIGKHDHITVLFTGGSSEIKYLQARSIVCADKHSHVINCPRTHQDFRRRPACPVKWSHSIGEAN